MCFYFTFLHLVNYLTVNPILSRIQLFPKAHETFWKDYFTGLAGNVLILPRLQLIQRLERRFGNY